MNDKASPPPASRPRLTPEQAGRVERANAVLQDRCTDKDAMSVAYHLGALEWRLKDMLDLIAELTGGES